MLSQEWVTCVRNPQVRINLHCAGELVKPSWRIRWRDFVVDEPGRAQYHLKVRQNDEKGDIESSPRYETGLAAALVADHNHPNLSLLHRNKPPLQSHQQQT